MLEQLAHSPTAFWLLALLITAIDSLAIVQPGQFTYRFHHALKIKLRASAHPYLMLGREPIISLISYPATPFFLCSISAPRKSRLQAKHALLVAKRLTRNCVPLSVSAIFTFLLFVFLGPILALQWGSGPAIITIWSTSYVYAALAVAYLFIFRDRFSLTRQRILMIALELVFCPFLMVNVVKKIIWQQTEQLNVHDLIQSFEIDRDRTEANVRSNLLEQASPLRMQ